MFTIRGVTIARDEELNSLNYIAFHFTSKTDQKIGLSTGSGEKLALSDLLEPLKSSSSLAAVKKQLNRVKSKKTLELPLHKGEVERVSYIESGPFIRGKSLN